MAWCACRRYSALWLRSYSSSWKRNVQVLKPLPFGLDQAAVDAVRRWKFKPGTLNGQPVDVIFNLTVNFKLN